MGDETKLDTKKRGETLCTQINIPIVVALKSFKSLIKEAKWVATCKVAIFKISSQVLALAFAINIRYGIGVEKYLL